MSGKKRDRNTLKDETSEEATVSELVERFESCSGSPSPEQYTTPKQLRREAAPGITYTVMASNPDPVLTGQAAILKCIEDMSKQFNKKFEEQAQTASEIKDEIRSNHQEMQQRVTVLEMENMSLRNELTETKDMVLRLQEQVNNNYLIFNGIPETPGETPFTLGAQVNDIILTNLGLPRHSCDGARRLGKPGVKPRPVRVYFLSQEHRFKVLSQNKNTPKHIFIGPDYPFGVRRVRKILNDKKKQVLKRKGTVTVNWMKYEITIDGTTHHWTDFDQPAPSEHMELGA